MPAHVKIRAPAKLNLHLGVGPLRADGYHEIATVLAAVSLYDDIIAEPAEEFRITVTGEGAQYVPTDGSNLAARAVQLLAEHVGVPPHVHLRIHKSIPVAAGLAGGSADAAGALAACNALWHTGLDRNELMTLGAQLGSDVPFALIGGAALGIGRGEEIEPVTAYEQHWALAVAERGLSTPKVYAELDRLRAAGALPQQASDAQPVLAALAAADSTELGATMRNDLKPAVLSLRPELAKLISAGRAAGALAATISGSGPTVAFLTADANAAASLTTIIAGSCRWTRTVASPVLGPLGPLSTNPDMPQFTPESRR